ncbi:hypothetical protein P3T76_015684 [Phytophthora citrophthora]|uniref:Uncharacterized protein n=1 Tax=Phytophthora citrophthora TaxID=4793 RepID=A0AAD9LA25_9STRA|nr:hypothetical protein P3T76_015684 [Phytophthora citrophthora]
MWTSVTQEDIDLLAVEAFLPIVLLLNYTLLIYLTVFYWKRRQERRVMLLLFVGTLGTVVVIPFAKPDDGFVETVNDVSEACCVLTFLLQITIIGYDLNKRFKMRSVMYLTYVAEVLILADLVSILLSCIVVFKADVLSQSAGQNISNVAENLNLAFIFIFRFYYIGISRGWRSIVETRKVEVCVYVLFATHEMPFNVLSTASGLNWEFAQAIWHRTTLTACLLITARTKIKRTSAAAGTSTNASSNDSKREKRNVGNYSQGLNLKRVFVGKGSPRLDFIRRSFGRSGGSTGRRNTGQQPCVVVPVKQAIEPQ